MTGSKILVWVYVERERLHNHDELDRERSRLRQQMWMNVMYEGTSIRVRTAAPIRVPLMVHSGIA